jgi:ribosomal protein L40E
MPCYRCGARQVDPDRGQSPWKRGVRGDQQVLVCPACQATHDWTTDLEHCSQCGSTRLVRRLGEVECRECGFVADPAEAGEPGAGTVPGAAPGLAEEVSQALDRVLGRRAGARV